MTNAAEPIIVLNDKLSRKNKSDNNKSSLLFFIILFLLYLAIVIYSLINIRFVYVLIGLIGFLSCYYLLSASYVFQKDKNYEIKILGTETETKIVSIYIEYKKKQVHLDYDFDNKGKIKLNYKKYKEDCVSYADKKLMLITTKLRVINYVEWFLDSYGLLAKV